MKKTRLMAGQCFILSSGEYSDYGHMGFMVALKDFDIKDAEKRFAEKEVDETGWFCELDYPDFLVKSGYCVPVEYREYHFASYGNFNEGDGLV